MGTIARKHGAIARKHGAIARKHGAIARRNRQEAGRSRQEWLPQSGAPQILGVATELFTNIYDSMPTMGDIGGLLGGIRSNKQD